MKITFYDIVDLLAILNVFIGGILVGGLHFFVGGIVASVGAGYLGFHLHHHNKSS